jgi:hypothetical protein
VALPAAFLLEAFAREAVDHAPAFRGRPLRKFTPVVSPEAPQNPSYYYPVISESYQELGMI